LGIGDWGLGIGDWAQSPIPNPQSPFMILKIININLYIIYNNLKFLNKIKIIITKLMNKIKINFNIKKERI